jgi:hypothetical protein
LKTLHGIKRAAVAAALLAASLPVAGKQDKADHAFAIEVLSSRAYMVSGGDALVRIDVPKNVPMHQVTVTLNGADVTGAFRGDASSRALTGLVSGMQLGNNTLAVDSNGRGHGRPTARMTLVNYPVQGPIISGPHEFPFACQTEDFVPFPGTPALGSPTDANCSIPTQVQYVYRRTGGGFALLPQPHSSLPADLAQTSTGVPYIVRLETGTINRAIYQTAILHNPNSGAPSPFSPPAGWNGKLIYPLGGGCQGGWYMQGDDLETVVDDRYLSQGYALASATLNTFGNNCNDLLSSETTLMVKERFIESYGAPKFTIGTGSSGGAYQSNQTGDNYPGTFDGIVTRNSFPDVTTGMVSLGDSRLLDIYFNVTRPGAYTVDKQKAISGYLQVNNIAFLSGRLINSGSARRMDPRVAFPAQITAGVGPEHRYDPATNPFGARGTVYDHTINVYGRINDTPVPGAAEFAQRPLDNVGVQYGLKALNDGVISVDEFLDLNKMIGGFDIDLNHIATRTIGYPGATRRAYQGGRILGAGNGSAIMPIITRRGNGDAVVNGDIHLRFWSNSVRERLIKANGHANNQVIVGSQAPEVLLISDMDRWLSAVQSDSSGLSLAEKVVRNKPGDVVDACWSGGVKIVEPQTVFGTGQCNQLFPVGLSAAIVAGAPVAHDIIKCQLKPIAMTDYTMPFTPEQRIQLGTIFPNGVCDWSKPGVDQVPSVPWASYGPSPVNRVFDVLNP